jgi:hypothetical protein
MQSIHVDTPRVILHFSYSLRPILLFGNIDVSRHILVINTYVLAKSNMVVESIKY